MAGLGFCATDALSGEKFARLNRWGWVIRIISYLGLTIGLVATMKAFVSLSGFWEDEFFPITFINERLPYFFVAVCRLDIHPPFYYLQEKLWGAIFTTDKGLLLNSVAWHVVSCVVVFRVGRAWLGSATGVLGAAFYALVPQVVWASVTLRPYGDREPVDIRLFEHRAH